MQGNRQRHGERANERRRQAQHGAHAQPAQRRRGREGNDENEQQNGRNADNGQNGNEARNGQGANGQRNGGGRGQRSQPMQSAAEIVVRGAALLADLQLETIRNVWRAQARTASMLGVPDYSEVFRVGDERARQIVSASTEQFLESARHARETVAEVQRQLGRLAEQQAIGISEEVRDQIEQLGRRTEEGLRAIQHVTEQEVDEFEQTTREMHAGTDDEHHGEGDGDDARFALADRSGEQAEGEQGSRRGRRS